MDENIGLLEITGSDFFKDLKKLFSLSSRTITYIAERVNTQKGFNINIETSKEIIKNTKLVADKLKNIIGVAEYLYQESNKRDISINNVMNELETYCEKKGFKNYKGKLDAVRSLVEVKSEYKTSSLRLGYEAGVLDSLESVSAVHDIRAVFKDDNEISQFVPIILMRFILKNDKNEEKTLTFQMAEKELKQLYDFITEYINKFEKVKNRMKGL